MIIRLEDAVEAIIDYRGKTPTKRSSGIPLITARVVKDGRIQEPDEFIAEEDYDEWMRRGLPKPGDVLITTEAPLGEVAQLDDRKVALAQRLICLRGRQGVLDNAFLKYLLMSPPLQDQLHSRGSGSTVTGIKQSELRKVEFDLPDFETQVWVGQILSSLDDKIELNRRMNETLEAMARAVFRSWFVGFAPVRIKARGGDPVAELGLSAEITALFPDSFQDSELGEIPEGWELKTIGEACEVVGGGTPSTSEPAFWDGEFAWATPRDMSRLDSPVLLATERYITQEGLAQISSGLLPIGTILMSSRAPIGYLAIAKTPVAINQGFIALKPTKGPASECLLHWCAENMGAIRDRANGSTFMEISKANFRPMLLATPKQEIFDAFSAMVRPLYDLITSNSIESKELATTRDYLLPRLLSGELGVSVSPTVSLSISPFHSLPDGLSITVTDQALDVAEELAAQLGLDNFSRESTRTAAKTVYEDYFYGLQEVLGFSPKSTFKSGLSRRWIVGASTEAREVYLDAQYDFWLFTCSLLTVIFAVRVLSPQEKNELSNIFVAYNRVHIDPRVHDSMRDHIRSILQQYPDCVSYTHFVSKAMTEFILLHELAHIHLEHSEISTHEHEFEADRIATRYFIHVLKNIEKGSDIYVDSKFLFAPLLMFEFLNAVPLIKSRNENSSSHPSILARKNQVLTQLLPELDERSEYLFDGFMKGFVDLVGTTKGKYSYVLEFSFIDINQVESSRSAVVDHINGLLKNMNPVIEIREQFALAAFSSKHNGFFLSVVLDYPIESFRIARIAYRAIHKGDEPDSNVNYYVQTGMFEMVDLSTGVRIIVEDEIRS